jgi:hypothetical protein
VHAATTYCAAWSLGGLHEASGGVGTSIRPVTAVWPRGGHQLPPFALHGLPLHRIRPPPPHVAASVPRRCDSSDIATVGWRVRVCLYWPMLCMRLAHWVGLLTYMVTHATHERLKGGACGPDQHRQRGGRSGGRRHEALAPRSSSCVGCCPPLHASARRPVVLRVLARAS